MSEKQPTVYEGIVDSVASGGLGGLKFKEKNNVVWKNPANDDIKKLVTTDVKGKLVRLVLDEADPNLFVHIEEVKEKDKKEDTVEVEDIPDAEPEEHPEKPLGEPEKGNTEEPEALPERYSPSGMISNLLKSYTSTPPQEEDWNIFKKLRSEAGKVEKAGKLTYISWADAWDHLKQSYPQASYTIYEDRNGMPYFADKTGCMVKVGVTVNNTEHVVWLPIMDSTKMYKSIKKEDVTTFEINKAIQRALTKAIAMQGFGLYVYRGEDIPQRDK